MLITTSDIGNDKSLIEKLNILQYDNLSNKTSQKSKYVSDESSNKKDYEILFSQNYACPDCNISFEELTQRMFSFNNHFGACPDCIGIGYLMKMDEDLIIYPGHGDKTTLKHELKYNKYLM